MRTANGMASLCAAHRKTTVLFLLIMLPLLAFRGIHKSTGIDSSSIVPENTWPDKTASPGDMPQHVQEFFAAHYWTVMSLYREHGVLPSIKLAQAMLESGYGSSELAKNGNNFFGIKRKYRSESGYYYKGDWYRHYESPAHSFEHHSLFLLEKAAVQELIEAGNCSYKDWILVLKRIRYAEDPQYTDKLIIIIERYRLYELDE